MPSETIQFSQTIHSLRLKRRGHMFRWYRDDGWPVSPLFTSFSQAVNFPEKNPMLTDKEWSEYYPAEGKSPEDLELDY